MPRPTKARQRLDDLTRKSISDPAMQTLLERAGKLSAVRGAEIGPHGISFKINPLDAEAASDLLDLLSEFHPKPSE